MTGKSCENCGVKFIKSTKPGRKFYCSIYEANFSENCPCRECIVASMCSNSCDERVDLRLIAFGLNLVDVDE